MARQISFEFDELPLVIEGGFEAGLVAGSADITYSRDGEWSVSAIYLDGYRERSQAELATMRANGLKPNLHERKPVELDAGTSLYLTIYDRLEHEWRDGVQEAVRDAVAADREAGADDYADYRRDVLREAV
jgi:hypothetical protein